MGKTQTDSVSEAPAAPQEERAAQRLRVLARLTEIQMEVVEATRTEAVETPQPGVDYCRRIAGIARSVRLTVLLEDKLSRPPAEQPQQAGQAGTADRSRSRMRVTMAMGAAATAGAGIEPDEVNRRFVEMAERLERAELADLVETCPAPEAVTRLCRMFGLPEEAGRWLDLGDAALADLATRPLADEVVPELAGALDRVRIRRRLRVVMALGAAIEAGTGDEAECDRRYFEMAGRMGRPELAEIADSCPAVAAVARLCPRFGLPPEEAARWVAEADRCLATNDPPPVEDDRPEPPDTG